VLDDRADSFRLPGAAPEQNPGRNIIQRVSSQFSFSTELLNFPSHCLDFSVAEFRVHR
jgi:hypothetical protein